MAIRAKFKCASILVTENSQQVTFNAVYSDAPNDPNSEWSKWTPSGSLTMLITNPAAYSQFKAGQEYFLDIDLVDKTNA